MTTFNSLVLGAIILFIIISAWYDIRMMVKLHQEDKNLKQNGVSFPSENYDLSHTILASISILSLLIWLSSILIAVFDTITLFGFVIWVTGVLLQVVSRMHRGLYAYHNSISPRVVEFGLYSKIRHPQYLGYILMTLGLGVWVPYLLAFVPLSCYLYYLIACEEDRLLAQRFGIKRFVSYMFVPYLI